MDPQRPCRPTLNWPASSLTTTVSASNPCALMLPHTALFGGDQRGIGVDLQGRDAEPIQMSGPGRPIGEDAIGMIGEAGDDGSGERAGAHIGHGFVIDDVIVVPGSQHFEEVEAALRTRGSEPGEPGVADLAQKPFLPLWRAPVSSAVTHAALVKPARSTARASSRKRCLPAINRRTTCRLEMTMPQSPQQRDQTRRRDLSLMILGQHEPAQSGSEMTVHASRQGARRHLAVRRLPAFSAKLHDVRADHQILHHEARIAFETRARRCIRLEIARLMDRQLRPRGAAPSALASRVRWLRRARLFHAAGLEVRFHVRPDVRTPRPALQPRNLVAQRPNR